MDKERNNYGIKEFNIGKLYSKILILPDKEKQQLIKYKNPAFFDSTNSYLVGNFIDVLSSIINNRCNNSISDMTINDVNLILDNISYSSTIENKESIMTNLIRNTSVTEQKWILKIILKDLKIGIGYETFLKSLDINTLNIYNSTSNLKEVCKYLTEDLPNQIKNNYINRFFSNSYLNDNNNLNNDNKYKSMYLKIMFPIKPMLASRMNINELYSSFNDVDCYVETKFDGERIQCHKQGNIIKFFSRNGNDFTYLYGPSLSKNLINLINAKDCILDGEVVVYDTNTNSFAPFGLNKTVAISKINNEQTDSISVNDSKTKNLCYVVFDIIYLKTNKGDEYSLLNESLSDRRLILYKIVAEVPNIIEIVKHKEVNSAQEILDLFNKSMDKGDEGVIVKKKQSLYALDVRSKDWIKLKSDYIEGLVDSLDLVILGGYYGDKGNKNLSIYKMHLNDNLLTSFLLGIKRYNSIMNCNEFVPFCKVGSGLTNDQIELLNYKLKSYFISFSKSNIKDCLEFNKNKGIKSENIAYLNVIFDWKPISSDKPDVIIKDIYSSIMLEIKGSEIIESTTYPINKTIRFPRVLKIRHDLTIDNCLDLSKLESYSNNNNANDSYKQHKLIVSKSKKDKLFSYYNKEYQNGTYNIISKSTEEIGTNTVTGSNFTNLQDKLIKNISFTPDILQETNLYNSAINYRSSLFSNYNFLIFNVNNQLKLCDKTINFENIKVNKINVSKEKQYLENLIVKNGGILLNNYCNKNKNTIIIADIIDVKVLNLIKNNDLNIHKSTWVVDCTKENKIIRSSLIYLVNFSKKSIKDEVLKSDKYYDSYYNKINNNELYRLIDNIRIEKNTCSKLDINTCNNLSNLFDTNKYDIAVNSVKSKGSYQVNINLDEKVKYDLMIKFNEIKD